LTITTASNLELANQPEAAFLPNDDFVVVWDAGTGYFPPANSPRSIRGRRFAPDGTPLGGTIEVAAQEGSLFKEDPDLAVQQDGSFLVVWRTSSFNPFESHILARHYAADGAPFGPELRVDTGPDPVSAAHVVTLDDDSFFVSWPIYRKNADSRALVGRQLSPAGVPMGEVVELLADLSIGLSSTTVAYNGQADLLVAARFDDPGGGVFDQGEIVGRVFRTADVFRDGFESGTFQDWSIVVP
jgi:hypothetical protein